MMIDRYVIRPAPRGFSVCDTWTGEPVVLALTPQTELSDDDARHLVELLNQRTDQRDRTIQQ
jgi:hypothetical protein